MLNQFRSYLLNKGYKEFSSNGSPSTAVDYTWRINKICEREHMTVEQLSAQINEYLKLYGINGEKWSEGRRSHQSYINALRQFRKFSLVQRFGGANA